MNFSLHMGKKVASQSLLSRPEWSSHYCICKVTDTCGGGLFQVESESDQIQLVTLPSRFQKQIWVKRGSFVLVEPHETPKGKIQGDIIHVLFPLDKKELEKEGKWPRMFSNKESLHSSELYSLDSSDASDSLDDLFINDNHIIYESD